MKLEYYSLPIESAGDTVPQPVFEAALPRGYTGSSCRIFGSARRSSTTGEQRHFRSSDTSLAVVVLHASVFALGKTRLVNGTNPRWGIVILLHTEEDVRTRVRITRMIVFPCLFFCFSANEDRDGWPFGDGKSSGTAITFSPQEVIKNLIVSVMPSSAKREWHYTEDASGKF